MNFKDSYKKDNEKIKVSEDTLIKLSQQIKNGKNKDKDKDSKINYRILAASIVAVLIISVTIFSEFNFFENNKLINNDKVKNNEEINKDSIVNNEAKEGILIPKIQIEKEEKGIMASRVPTLIYEGRVYLSNRNKISLVAGKALMDKKIGITKNLCQYIQDDGTIEGYVDLDKLEGLVGPTDGQEVYTVKGYDKSFRLITYEVVGGIEYIEIWECLNGILVSNGEDVFGLMKIRDNINTVTWDTFNNWNEDTPDPKELEVNSIVDEFIKAVYNSKPYSLEDKEFKSQFFYDEVSYYAEGEEKQKFLYLKLNDGTEIEMRLFSNGYIQCSLIGYVFKVEDNAFNNMWNYMQ